MPRDISRFEKGQYDLIVVGGGINGAAIANIAAESGLKVALLEKKISPEAPPANPPSSSTAESVIWNISNSI